MSNVTSIDPYSSLLSFLQQVCPKEAVEKVTEAKVAAMEPAFEKSSLARSEQEKIRDLSQIYLPPPTLTPPQLLEIYRTIDTRLSLALLGAPESSGRPIATTETAILTTVIHDWVKAEKQPKESSSFISLVEKFVETDPPVTVENLGLKQTLSQITGLPKILGGIPRSSFNKAYLLAEQKILSSLLDKWLESEAEYAKISKEIAKRQDMKRDERIKHLLRHDLVRTLVTHTHIAPLSQPLLSVISFSCLLETQDGQIQGILPTVSTGTVDPTFHVQSTPGFDVEAALAPLKMPKAFATELSMYAQGLSLTALTWATPAASALKKMDEQEPTHNYLTSISTKGYCFALEKILHDPATKTFLEERTNLLVRQGLLSFSEGKEALASLRALMLLQGLVALYESEAGGVTPQEIEALLAGTLEIEPDNILVSMAQLVNIELQSMTPKHQQEFLSSALDVIISSHAAQAIVEPTRCFLSLWDPKYSRAVAMSCRS